MRHPRENEVPKPDPDALRIYLGDVIRDENGDEARVSEIWIEHDGEVRVRINRPGSSLHESVEDFLEKLDNGVYEPLDDGFTGGQ